MKEDISLDYLLAIEEYGSIIKPTIVLDTNNIENAFRLANSGLGITFIPEGVVTRDKIQFESNLYTLGNPTFKNNIVISYKKDAMLTPAAEAFLRFTKGKFIQF